MSDDAWMPEEPSYMLLHTGSVYGPNGVESETHEEVVFLTDYNSLRTYATAKIAELTGEMERLRGALDKINEVRNSIIGTQAVNWSAHVYPLVAALDDVGIEGMSYDNARPHYKSLIERAEQAEQRAADLQREVERLRGQLVLTQKIKQKGLHEAEQRAADLEKALQGLLNTCPQCEGRGFLETGMIQRDAPFTTDCDYCASARQALNGGGK